MWVFLSKCRQQVWTKSSSAVWHSSAWAHTLHGCVTRRASVLLRITCNGFNGKHMPSGKKIETPQMEKNLRELGIPSWTWKKLSVENMLLNRQGNRERETFTFFFLLHFYVFVCLPHSFFCCLWFTLSCLIYPSTKLVLFCGETVME